MKERDDIIKLHGTSNKERILKDAKFKELKEETEKELNELKDIFKKYTEKNRNKLAPHEIDMMSKSIDYLRRNLNILDDKFKTTYQQRTSSNLDNDLTQPFVVDGDFNGDEMTEAEKGIMTEFKKNDDELDLILDQVGKGLEQLQGKTRKIGEAQNKQSDLLA